MSYQSMYKILRFLYIIIFPRIDFMVTCCGDQSVNSMVQSFNVYPPNFAVYLIGRSLLPQGQSISTMYNSSSKLVSSHIIFFFFIISIILKQF